MAIKYVDETKLNAAMAYEAGKIREKLGSSAQLDYDFESGKGFGDYVEAIPSGGGGMQLIANGTFTGAGVHIVEIPVGKKMPQTNFIFNCWVDGGTTITPTAGTDRVVVTLQQLVQKRFCGFDLSTDGTKTIVSKLTYPTVGADGTTVTNRTPNESCQCAGYVRQTTVANETQGIQSIVRVSTGFTIKLSKNNQYTFSNGITYNWEVLYIGSDAANDIVEVP